MVPGQVCADRRAPARAPSREPRGQMGRGSRKPLPGPHAGRLGRKEMALGSEAPPLWIFILNPSPVKGARPLGHMAAPRAAAGWYCGPRRRGQAITGIGGTESAPERQSWATANNGTSRRW